MNKPPSSFSNKFVISLLYVIQGIFFNLPNTIPLTYSVIPPYGILAYFSALYLPFSFKFVIGTSIIIKHLSSKHIHHGGTVEGRRGS